MALRAKSTRRGTLFIDLYKGVVGGMGLLTERPRPSGDEEDLAPSLNLRVT